MADQPDPITPQQMQKARELLGWSRDFLAARTETMSGFVQIYETEGRVRRMFGREKTFDPLGVIRIALEAAGIEFVDENGGGPGVRLTKGGQAHAE